MSAAGAPGGRACQIGAAVLTSRHTGRQLQPNPKPWLELTTYAHEGIVAETLNLQHPYLQNLLRGSLSNVQML